MRAGVLLASVAMSSPASWTLTSQLAHANFVIRTGAGGEIFCVEGEGDCAET